MTLVNQQQQNVQEPTVVIAVQSCLFEDNDAGFGENTARSEQNEIGTGGYAARSFVSISVMLNQGLVAGECSSTWLRFSFPHSDWSISLCARLVMSDQFVGAGHRGVRASAV